MTQLQQERRQFAIYNQQLLRSQKLQKQRAEKFVEIIKKKDNHIHELEREKQKLPLFATLESYLIENLPKPNLKN